MPLGLSLNRAQVARHPWLAARCHLRRRTSRSTSAWGRALVTVRVWTRRPRWRGWALVMVVTLHSAAVSAMPAVPTTVAAVPTASAARPAAAGSAQTSAPASPGRGAPHSLPPAAAPRVEPKAEAKAEAASPSGDATVPLTDADLLRLAEAEVIEVWDARPEKPYDRDTALRLSGEELARRGATDLGSALALLPDVAVREAGRGGSNVDIRGARKGAVRVLIDGVPVSDPWYGTFDVAAIPVTDIVQIRVATTPTSPIDGPGGPGGVIEVHTRDGVGAQVIAARLTVDSLPRMQVAASARVALAPRWGLRLSTTHELGAREFSVPTAGATLGLGEARRAATFAARLEYRDRMPADARPATRRLVIDGFVDDRHYLAPPSETKVGTLLLIDREQTQRVIVGGDANLQRWQAQTRVWGQQLTRRSVLFRDGTQQEVAQKEDLSAQRLGLSALATRSLSPRWRLTAATFVDGEHAAVRDGFGNRARGTVLVLEPALEAQVAQPKWHGSAALGAAVPAGIAATPWVEAKLVASWQPRQAVMVTATLARKGRVPSLRERFDLSTGNEALAPELANVGEVRGVVHGSRGHAELAGHARAATGTTRIDPATGRLGNLGDLTVGGLDAFGHAVIRAAVPTVRLGGGYFFVRATSAESADALDRLPRHRGEAWVESEPLRRVALRLRWRRWGQSLDQATWIAGGQVVDLQAAWRLGASQTVVRVDDVGNARPELRSGYLSAGRTVAVSVSWQW